MSASDIKGIRPSVDAYQTMGTANLRYATLFTYNLSDGDNNVALSEIRNMLDNGGGGGGTPGVTVHNLLTGRDAVNAHPIDAVGGLRDVVTQVGETQTALTTTAAATNLNTTNVTALTGRMSAAEAAATVLTGRVTALENDDGSGQTAVTALQTAMTAAQNDIEQIQLNAVFYESDGNISFPAGLELRVKMTDGTKFSVLKTDNNGNTIMGDITHEIDMYSSVVPSVTVGSDAADTIVLQRMLADFLTEADIAEELAYKADLVSGVVPDSQIPAHVKVTNWGPVATKADLLSLTSATVNDRAFVGTAEPYATYYLLALPPTTAANWLQASGTDTSVSGILSINGLTGPNVQIDLANLPNVQTEFQKYALAASLANYATIVNAALQGATVNTPASSANNTLVVNAAWVRTLLTSNLANTLPAMNGAASAGSASTVARADHVHPTDTSLVQASGNVATATALQNARTIQTNLASTTAASFNGTANATPGVQGVLGRANGGTGAADVAGELAQLFPSQKSAAPSFIPCFNSNYAANGFISPATLFSAVFASILYTIPVAAWTATSDYWTATTSIPWNDYGEVGLAGGATKAQFDDYVAAGIWAFANVGGYVQMAASNQIPTMDLPVKYTGKA